MRAIDLIWLAMTLPGLVATAALLAKRWRTCRDALLYSKDREDWRLARHVRNTEVVRLVKQVLLTAAVLALITGRVPVALALVAAVSLLLLYNSAADLRYGCRRPNA